MSTATAKGYLVRCIQDAPTHTSACGQSTRPLTGSDGVACNLHVTFVTDSVKHYHRQCTRVPCNASSDPAENCALSPAKAPTG